MGKIPATRGERGREGETSMERIKRGGKKR